MKVDVPRLLAELGIEAKRSRNRLHAQCPSHADHKPSWAILDAPDDPKHGRHRCLSCGFSGDAVELARVVLGLHTRVVAREWVEQNALRTSRVGLPLGVVVERASGVRSRFEMPSGFVSFNGLSADEFAATKGGAYLLGRGVWFVQAVRWGLGQAIDGKLAGRVVFPVKNGRGDLLSYTARTFGKSPVRYKMPSAKEGPDPGAVFGEALWPAVGARRTLYLSEGALKALAIDRALVYRTRPGDGIGAVGGSYLSPEAASKLGTWPRIVFVADPDEAGRKFAKALRAALARGSEVLVCDVPGRKQADEVDREVLRAALLARIPVSG